MRGWEGIARAEQGGAELAEVMRARRATEDVRAEDKIEEDAPRV